MKKLLLVIGILILFAAEFLKVYLIMPFPGSQQSNSIGIAYFLHNYTWLIRIAALLLIVYSLVGRFNRWKGWQKGILIALGIFYLYFSYLFNFRFMADKMFYQPENKRFAAADSNKVKDDKLVIATVINGEAKAYPIQLIGYHHQVQDTVGGEPIIVTYCTVCRTGRIYSPVVNGVKEQFRLVGMDHFNAMFEDNTTKSWWRQATGEAIAGPLKGNRLQEIPSAQMTLHSWLEKYPGTHILQPDTLFKEAYADLDDFDKGTINSGLEKRDSASWQLKSWVVGIDKGTPRAYDWNDLVQERVINDSLPGLPVVLILEPDSVSFHTYHRMVNGQSLHFAIDDSTKLLKDAATQSLWNYNGQCTDGPLKGATLSPVQSYQEFWHSWQTFHPATSQYHK